MTDKRDSDELIFEIQQVAGVDAYLVFPDSKRMIPEAVLWGFASGCLLSFVKGFIDFEALGKSARKRVEGLLAAWKQRRDFEAFCKSERITEIVDEALAGLPDRLTASQIASGRRELEKALEDMGLPKASAKAQAQKIAERIETWSNGPADVTTD